MSEINDPTCWGEQEFEDALEPVHLIKRSDVVMRAGIMMLGAGTSSLRVRELMRRVAASVGLDGMQANIFYTSIGLTVSRRGIHRTKVAEIASPGVDAHRIAQLQALGNELAERSTAAELEERLDKIAETGRLWPAWLLAILVGLACGSVTLLTHGGWREILAVVPASSLAFLLNRWLTRRQVNHLATVLLSAATASAGFVAITRLVDLGFAEPSGRIAAGFIAASIFLIPGFPLVTGGLDLARIDLQAGVPRITYAAMVVLAITIGVWLVASLAGVSPDPVPALTGTWWVVWIPRICASFLAVFGWAMMFNSPFAVAVTSGVVAVLANVPRLILLDHQVSNHVATFIGCFLIGLGCAVLGGLFQLEKIIMTVPTLLVSIPGSSALQTLLYFDQADVMLAVQNGISTVLVVIAMVSGLSGARMLTDPEWAFTKPDPPSLIGVFTESAKGFLTRR